MYAIVDIAGQQFKVEPRQKVFVHRLEANEGDTVEFKNVLLFEKDGKVQVGKPTVEGSYVSAKVLGNLKGDKVIVFKKRRRKGYRVLNGHRQYLTQIFIQGISANGEAIKLEEAPVRNIKAKSEVSELVNEQPVAKKKAATKSAAKKAVAPKSEVKKAPAKRATKKTKE